MGTDSGVGVEFQKGKSLTVCCSLWHLGKGKSTQICIVPHHERTSKALRYHAFSRDLTVLPAHPCSSANGVNH